MKNLSFLSLILITSISQYAFADSGPTETVLKSKEYVGLISGKTKNGMDKICKLVINFNQFTNQDYPGGPIKYQHVDYRLYTGVNETDLANKDQAELISRTNAKPLTNSEISAIPMKTGSQNTGSSNVSLYDGKILYQKVKNGDAMYSGNTEIWISNVSANVFDVKPSDVHLLQKGGIIFATNTEADFTCKF